MSKPKKPPLALSSLYVLSDIVPTSPPFSILTHFQNDFELKADNLCLSLSKYLCTSLVITYRGWVPLLPGPTPIPPQ